MGQPLQLQRNRLLRDVAGLSGSPPEAPRPGPRKPHYGLLFAICFVGGIAIAFGVAQGCPRLAGLAGLVSILAMIIVQEEERDGDDD